MLCPTESAFKVPHAKRPVYFFALHLSHGGVERSICELASAFARHGYPTHIVVSYHLGDIAYPLEPSVHLHYLSEDKPNRSAFQEALRKRNFPSLIREGWRALGILWRRYRRLKQALKGCPPEALLILSRKEQCRLLPKRQAPTQTRVFHLHYDPQSDPELLAHPNRYFSKIQVLVPLLADYVPLLEHALSQQAQKPLFWPIGHFLPPEDTLVLQAYPKSESASQTHSNSDLPESTDAEPIRLPIVLAAGRLSPEKGFDRLLESWAIFQEQLATLPNSHASPARAKENWQLVIYGEGQQASALQHQAKTLGIEDSVRFLPFVSAQDLQKAMLQACLFVLPSRTEGFGFVLIEAALTGLPCLAFDIPGGPQRLIISGETGYRVQNCAEMAEKIRTLTQDHRLRKKMALASQQLALQWTEERIFPAWLALAENAFAENAKSYSEETKA